MKALYVVFLVRRDNQKVESFNIISPWEDIAEEHDKQRAHQLVAECLRMFNLNILDYSGAGLHKVSRKMMEEVLA